MRKETQEHVATNRSKGDKFKSIGIILPSALPSLELFYSSTGKDVSLSRKRPKQLSYAVI